MLNAMPFQTSLVGNGNKSNDDDDDDDEPSGVIVILGSEKLNGRSPPSSANHFPPPSSSSSSSSRSAASHSRNTSLNSQSMMDTQRSSDSATHEGSHGTHSNFQYSDSSFLPYTPRHSDYTIPTANHGYPKTTSDESTGLHNNKRQQSAGSGSGYDDDDDMPRRSIFGNAVQRKYKTDLRTDEESKWNANSNGLELLPHKQPQELQDHDDLLLYHTPPPQSEIVSNELHSDGLYKAHVGLRQQQRQHGDTDPRLPSTFHHSHRHRHGDHFISDVSLPDFREHPPGFGERLHGWVKQVTALFSPSKNHPSVRRKSSDIITPQQAHHPQQHRDYRPRRKRPHETIHAQSLLLGLAFCAVWSANNVMAPNLTEMADFFGLEGAAQRDLYLGSYCALATGVFSFPIAAGIGVLTDLMSRQRLFCITVAGGGLSAIITARAKTYPVLFAARLVNGGFMAGSTPVAFSFLGDMFAVEERNAASSGLTAMMGLGIILGQVYAGMQGPSVGWQHAFYASGFLALIFAFLCLLLVQEPERGGKEKVLQDMIRAGTRYDRKLTWSGFWHAVRHNQSNSILLWQGFFSSLPWGVIFVFLNDYLSQERGFSIPAATYLVFLFGIGCAAGGVLGGYWGQLVQRRERYYLPLFMSVTTLLGIIPFVLLLNTTFTRAHGAYGIILAVSSGLVASLPSVNVRPCLINVNPPESRGATLTAANLLISLGRGVGPSCVTLMSSMFQADRSFSINVTLILFWVISAIQLALLARTLPKDQDMMEASLLSYAQEAMEKCKTPLPSSHFSVSNQLDDHDDCNESVEVSIEDRMIYFDGTAARQTLHYVKEGMEEFRQSLAILPCACGIPESSEDEESPRPSPSTSMLDTSTPSQWAGKEKKRPTETTPLIV